MGPNERRALLLYGGEGAAVPTVDLASRPPVHAHRWKRCGLCGQAGAVGDRPCPLEAACPLNIVQDDDVGLCMNCLALIKRGLPYAPDVDTGGL